MSLLHHTLRAILLALLLPALLVPSGLGLSVCLCSDMGSPSSAAAVPSCCAERGAVTQDDVCPRIGREAGHSCEHCRHFQTGQRELSTPTNSSVQASLACLPAPIASLVFDAPRDMPFARRTFDKNGLAPPGSARLLPLRI
jgi:hypothetical protein